VSLADLDDFAAVCGVPDDPVAAQAWLDQATTLLQSLTGQTLLPVTDDAVLLDGDGTNVIVLPEVPVTAVASVEAEGVPLSTDEYEWSSDGLLRITGGPCVVWPNRYQALKVVYSHGFNPMPNDLALACAGIACRLSTGAKNLASGGEVTFEAVGAYQVRYATPTPGLTGVEAAIVDRYRVPA